MRLLAVAVGLLVPSATAQVSALLAPPRLRVLKGMNMGMGKTMSESYSMGMGKTMSESYSMGKRTSKGKTSMTPKTAHEDPVDSDPSLPPPPQAPPWPTPAPPTECTTTVELNVDCTALDDANINDAVALWLSDQSSAMAT
ncbi:hypothetical protein TeGR_g6900, partial [Tetraparma gracilis]